MLKGSFVGVGFDEGNVDFLRTVELDRRCRFGASFRNTWLLRGPILTSFPVYFFPRPGEIVVRSTGIWHIRCSNDRTHCSGDIGVFFVDLCLFVWAKKLSRGCIWPSFPRVIICRTGVGGKIHQRWGGWSVSGRRYGGWGNYLLALGGWG